MAGTWATDWATGNIVTAAEFRKSLGCVADSTLGVAAASFDFTGLPTTYAHLMIVVYSREDTVTTLDGVNIRFNNDTAANYDYQYLRGSGASATAAETFGVTAAQSGLNPGSSGAANLFATTEIWVPHYAGSSNNKAFNATSAAKLGTSAGQMTHQTTAGYWRSSAAISRVTIFPNTGNFIAGSRASVYVMGS